MIRHFLPSRRTARRLQRWLARQSTWRLGSAAVGAVGLGITALSGSAGTNADALRIPALAIGVVALVTAGATGAVFVARVSRNDHVDSYDYIEAVGEDSHLRRVCQLGVAAIGSAHATPQSLRSRLKRDPSLLRVVGRRLADDEWSLCGYTLVYPISAAADRQIHDRSIRAGSELPIEAFVSLESASGIYIGMILGTDADAKAYAKAMLRRELLNTLSVRRNVEHVYGRPASKGGRKLLTDLGFEPIGGDHDIWMINAEDLRAGLLISVP